MSYLLRSGRRGYLMKTESGEVYVDYKKAEDLRRLMTPNGKIYSRKRTGISSGEQRKVAKAIKRARFMALLPFTSATL
ncbi:MAG: 30S ribosomal protein S18 [Planctomycetes bacterium]|nr:30S ribosomal protein S18 [Planctomycetota bacterium]